MKGAEAHRLATLRERATRLLADTPATPNEAPVDPRELIEELRLMYAELELQQEELVESQLRAETMARQRETLFREAPIGLMRLDASHALFEANAHAQMVLGLSTHLGRIAFAQFVAVESVRQWHALVSGVAQGTSTGELVLRRTTGDRVDARVHVAWLADGELLVCVDDLTTTQRAEVAAREASNRYARLVNDANDGVISIRWDSGLVETANPAMRRLLRTGRVEGRALVALFPPRLATLQQLQIERIFADDDGGTLELAFLADDGQSVETECSGGFLAEGGGRVLYLLVRDLSERRALERERLDLQERAHHRQQLETLGRLAGGVAHDFNNVLAAIMACLDEVRHGSPDQVAAALRDAELASQRGRELAQSMLSVGRRAPPRLQRMSLRAVCEKAIALLRRGLAPNLLIDARLSVPGDVVGDEGQWVQVVLDACLNARDAMPEGGTLTLRLDDSPRELTLEIRDTGRGMAEDVREKAFEPFFTTKGQGVGAGLGLAHARSVAEAHGVQYELHSELGTGTVLRFRFPVPSTAPAPPDPPPAAPPGFTEADHVLLVDDDELVRRGGARTLRRLGCRVTAVDSGSAALAALAEEPSVNLVVTDHFMPGMTGSELLERIRDRWPGLPVVVTSGLLPDDRLAELARLGAGAVLLKPFDAGALRKALLEALGR